jgi:cysteine desulfurase
MMINEIYLDNSATTKPFDMVIEYMDYLNKNVYGNPSSLHKKGIEAEKYLNGSRRVIAETINSDPSEVYFTSGGTEANNLAILGCLAANPRLGRHIIVSSVEHQSVLEVCNNIIKEGGMADYLPVSGKGTIDTDLLEYKLNNENIALISVMQINNETGLKVPIAKISDIISESKSKPVFHVDAIQGYGKIALDPIKNKIDLMSLSSHKIHGPKGVGALFIRKKLHIKPIMFGGGQEKNLRPGTENMVCICGFAKAAELMYDDIKNNYDHVADLKKYFLENLKVFIDNYWVNSAIDSSPYIINISFPGIRGEVLLHHLEKENIYVSTGAACSSKKKIHSHVLKAMGLDPEILDSAIRISFSIHNSREEIDLTIQALKEILTKVRRKKFS